MTAIWQSLFSALRTAPVDPDLDAAVERVIDGLEPKLKFAGGYPQRYRKAVAHALTYARALAEAVPGPVTINREAYVQEPFVRAIFASPDDFHSALCMSQAMRDYSRQHECRLGTPVYGLLGMRRQERILYGTEINGDQVRHEVPQTAVIFSDHTLTGIAPSETEARERLMFSFLDSLVAEVHARIAALRQERNYLEQKRGNLLARLHSADAGQRFTLQAELDTLAPRWQETTAGLEPGRYGEYLDSVLLQPEQYLRLEPHTLHLDDMNIRRVPGPGVREIRLTDLIGRDRRRWSIALLHCQQPGMAPMTEQLEQASRWLQI